MLESYLLIATLVLANGDTIEAVGDEYPTYSMCMEQNIKEMEDIKADIKDRPTIFIDLRFECVHLKPESEGVKTDAD